MALVMKKQVSTTVQGDSNEQGTVMNKQVEISTKHLLVIDDEEDICELVSDIAELVGFTTDSITTLNNTDTLDQISEVDVLALDLSMPGIDGIEVIHYLEHLPKKPQLILMTGFERSVLEGARKLANQLKIPVLGTLSKPFNVQEVKSLLLQPFNDIPTTSSNSYQRQAKSYSVEEIESALEKKEFIPYFQPQIDLATGQIHGVEALVRWHNECQIVMPDDFLPTIESNKLILPLTLTVIEQTMAQMALWQQAGLPDMQVSINLSAAYLDELNLASIMPDLLALYPVVAENITFEITERIALDGSNQPCLDALTRLRLKGFYLSLDDFGTGYSSLAQLNQLPFNEIKIDKGFVLHALSSPISQTIVQSSISLAKQLGVRCIAEGVETAEIEQFLIESGCDVAQGYLYSPSLPSKSFIEWALCYMQTD
jgi:EAL domain-containing protein (putative c-di-GMP-specific phosphodiesterase class I)